MKPMKEHTIDSLRARCEEEGHCWLWTGYFGNGVPMVYSKGRMRSVRLVLLELQGPVRRSAKYFAPTCGNAACVCPDHIAQRHPAEHMAHMGRNVDSRGPARRIKLTAHARATKAKLTIEQAREIRMSTESGPVLAERYGVSRSIVNRIRRGEAWADQQNPFWRLAA